MNKELNAEFSPIEGTNYGINEYGQVRNYKTKTILKTFLISDYPAVNISMNGKRKTMYVHHLLAMVFLNYTPSRGMMSINHIDADKENCRLDNIEVITHRRNSALTFINKKRALPTGVTINKGGKKPYKAQINLRGVVTYLGSFETTDEAHAAYMEASDAIIATGELPQHILNRKKYERY